MFFSVLCLLCLCMRLFICALWSPAGKGLTSWLSCVVSNCVCYFPIGILGQVWYLIVSIPDLCILTYFTFSLVKVRKKAKIRNRYNQAPHLTQDTNGKVTTSKLDITKESQEASPLPAGDHKASINRRAQKHDKYKTK